MKNKKGITLVSLIITIVVLLILASIATYSGISVIKSSRLTAFTTELKIMQTQVNALYETKKEEAKGYGEDISGNHQAIEILQELKKKDPQFANIEEEIAGYKYWDKSWIERLGIEGIEQTFLINIEKRSVVSYGGFEEEGQIVYTLNQLPDNLYNVEYEEAQIALPTFEVRKENIGRDKWRITIYNINYGGYINKWEVKYKLKEQENWRTSQDLSFVVNEQGTYQIKIKNNNIETVEIQEITVVRE